MIKYTTYLKELLFKEVAFPRNDKGMQGLTKVDCQKLLQGGSNDNLICWCKQAFGRKIHIQLSVLITQNAPETATMISNSTNLFVQHERDRYKAHQGEWLEDQNTFKIDSP